MALVVGGGGAGAIVPGPDVTPATGGGGVPVVPGFTAFDPAAVGYEQSEVFLSGTASAYQPAGTFGTDGKLAVAAASTAPYTTRAVVMRPTDPHRFNGTVVVEWLNVSGGADAGPDWILAHTELVREGMAWVGVSAQKVGVDALRSDDPLRGDAVRYAGLSHPGDSYSYDIFSQAGQAIRDDGGLVLGGLQAEHLLAVGESQSAGRMVTYIDAVHPLAGVYDGFLVHSRSAGGAPLSQAPQPNVPVPTPLPIRDDLGEPVLVFQAETDVVFSNLGARQPDTDRYRLWEVAGTAHFDFYGLSIGRTDIGDGRAGEAFLASMQNPTNQPNPNFTCNSPINTGPAHYVLDAAFRALDRWVTKGVLPPIAPRLETTGVSPVVFATDADGNVLGGIRTPAVDAPVATLSGLGQSGNQFCFLFGTTQPLPADRIEALYPTHGRFVAAWTRATRSARRAGFLVPADARELVVAAAHSDIGR
ncbi:MAG TPA: alpha/beta hydrolase domain-containing protein [Acidimicrobiales bacterium]|nr:alpha/beta hydrolase domain-containing protein [Acidimicrobiales bacterium]